MKRLPKREFLNGALCTLITLLKRWYTICSNDIPLLQNRLLIIASEVRYLDTNFSHGLGRLGEAHAHDPEVREREVFATLYYDLSRNKVSKDKFTG